MNNHRIEFSFKRNRRTVLLTALLLTVSLFLIFGLSIAFHWIDLPEFLKPLFGQNDSVEILPGDEGQIYDALYHTPPDDVYVQYDVGNLDAVSQLIQASPVTRYYLKNTVTFYSNTGETTRQNTIYRSGVCYRIETYNESGVLLYLVICDGTSISETDYTRTEGGETRIFPNSSDFIPEAYAKMPITVTYQNMISDADSTDIMRTALVRSVYGTVYLIEIGETIEEETQESKRQEHIYISMEYAIPIHAEITMNGKPQYALNTTLLSEEFTEEDLFVIKKSI